MAVNALAVRSCRAVQNELPRRQAGLRSHAVTRGAASFKIRSGPMMFRNEDAHTAASYAKRCLGTGSLFNASDIAGIITAVNSFSDFEPSLGTNCRGIAEELLSACAS
jgi:hypothetical protein